MESATIRKLPPFFNEYIPAALKLKSSITLWCIAAPSLLCTKEGSYELSRIFFQQKCELFVLGPHQTEYQHNRDRLAECLCLCMAIIANLTLVVGTLKQIPLFFMPWLLFYGFELVAGWMITLFFLVLPGKQLRSCVCPSLI